MSRVKDRKRKLSIFLMLAVLFIALALILSGCGAQSKQAPNYSAVDRADDLFREAEEEAGRSYDSDAAAPAYPGEASKTIAAESYPDGGVVMDGRQKLIRNASLVLEVKDILETNRQLEQLAENNQGLVTNSRIYKIGEERLGASITLRVPSQYFTPVVSEITNMGKLKDEHKYTDDVTMHYLDLEARIRNLQAQEERFLEILQKAESIEDILSVERELERVRGSLESYQGEFKYLKDRVDYATINIDLQEEKLPYTAVTTEKMNLGEQIIQTLIRNTNWVLRAAAAVLVFAIGLIPLLVPLAAIILLLIFLNRFRQGKKQNIQASKGQGQDLSQQ